MSDKGSTVNGSTVNGNTVKGSTGNGSTGKGSGLLVRLGAGGLIAALAALGRHADDVARVSVRSADNLATSAARHADDVATSVNPRIGRAAAAGSLLEGTADAGQTAARQGTSVEDVLQELATAAAENTAQILGTDDSEDDERQNDE